MSSLSLVTLSPGDLDDIMELETRTFEPAIQATREKYELRFELGHRQYGLCLNGALEGIASVLYTNASPDDPDGFPQTFAEYSTLPMISDGNAMFFYNLGLSPVVRSMKNLELVIHTAIRHAIDAGCRDGFADGALPTLQGNHRLPADPRMKEMIARYEQLGAFPGQREFRRDPALAAYYRLTRCRCLWLIRNFIPEDVASAGWRVIMHLDLQAWHETWLSKASGSCGAAEANS